MTSTDHITVAWPRLKPVWARISLVIWAFSSLAYALFIGPALDAASWTRHAMFLPLGPWSPLGMALPSLALGLLIALYRLSPLPVRILFKQTRARIIGAVSLFVVLPLGVLSVLPISAGWVAVLQAPRLLYEGDIQSLAALVFLFFVFCFCYICACLFSSGIQSHGWRLAAYLLIGFAALALTFPAGTAQWFVV